ncbi:hypothetical protein, partial [Roseisolibacter sp. H3M3-2]|uniref:hypothetical protein n=1 Tax=Roseisolibacter sp. H3M3-2 TaxID=3031323 RepID=UPI0023D9F548
MSRELPVARLLRWRLEQGAAGAPPPPSAARLLALARPWWETAPARLLAAVERLRQMPPAYGFARTPDARARAGHPVPVLVDAAEPSETYAHALYLAVRAGRMRLRFRLDADGALPGDALELTVGADAPDGAPFEVAARRAEG